MTEDIDLKKEIKNIADKIDKLSESGITKKVKPKRIGKMQKRKGYMNFFIIRENNEMEVKKLPVDEGTTIIEEAPRLATSDYVLSWKGNPTVILPIGSSEPYSPSRMESYIKDNKMSSAGWRLLANRSELGDIKPKKKMSGMVIFLIIAAILAGAYFLLR